MWCTVEPHQGILPKHLDLCSGWKLISANAGDIGDTGSIPGLGRSPGEEQDNPLQYSCLENPRDRGASWAARLWAQGGRGWLVLVSAWGGFKACRDIWAMRDRRAEGSEERPTGQETDRWTDMERIAGCISAQDFNAQRKQ